MFFWTELKRRKVVQVVIVYAVVAWLLVQIVATVQAPLNLPPWFDTAVIVFLAVGFPVAAILSWAYDLSSSGLVKTPATAAGPEPIRDVTDTIETGREHRSSSHLLGEVLPNSVAVLPFINASPDPDKEFFAIGLHEEILNQLAKIKDLKVISRTSVVRYANGGKSIPEIARELRVGAVMEGSVRYAGNRLRVTAQLIDAATDQHLWSDTYDRQFDDIFTIESDIALSVANALRAELSQEEKERIEKPPTSSPAAYEHFMQALAILTHTLENDRVQPLLDQAIALDPDFALAYAMKAGLLADKLIDTVEGAAVTPSARQALLQTTRGLIDKAIEIDANIGWAYSAAANLDFLTWRWAEAESAFRRATALGSKHDVLNGRYGWLLSYLGRTEDAIAHGRYDVALNPSSWIPYLYLGFSQGYAGKYQDAIETLATSVEIAPGIPLIRYWIGFMYIAIGDREKAFEMLQVAERLMADNRMLATLPELAYGYGRLGHTGDAQRIVDEIAELAGNRDIGAGSMAMAQLAIGGERAALQYLETVANKAKAHEVDEGFYNAMALKMNATNDPLLEQPKFADVLDRIRGD